MVKWWKIRTSHGNGQACRRRTNNHVHVHLIVQHRDLDPAKDKDAPKKTMILIPHTCYNDLDHGMMDEKGRATKKKEGREKKCKWPNGDLNHAGRVWSTPFPQAQRNRGGKYYNGNPRCSKSMRHRTPKTSPTPIPPTQSPIPIHTRINLFSKLRVGWKCHPS